jgi:hypothetical protein
VINNALTLLVLGGAACGMAAQEAEPKPIYFGISAGFSQGDLRSYLGGKTFGHSFELGYDWTNPEYAFGLRAHAAFSKWTGDYSKRIEVEQGLVAWRFGADLSFNTPLKALKPYLGGGLTFWDGVRYTDSQYLGNLSPTITGPLISGKYPDRKPKVGIRLGAEYKVFGDVHVSLDYNAYMWRSVNQAEDRRNGMVGSQTAINGYNPVNPSWIGFTVKYYFKDF